ncbi:uncharacterized protein LOC134532715 isoform X4 [Bacillus rossius redtenbacheri]|uniref:uncharacterized protein LOC134532715 isoform X4 n=1 Tax=Bacillus rossius redtenbacheri TaxID=93214 RepID=UPI002FDF04D4
MCLSCTLYFVLWLLSYSTECLMAVLEKMGKVEELQIRVRRVKEMFLSGNIKKQIEAAKTSLNLLNDDINIGDYFLQEDVVATMAEAMAKMHNELLKLIMQCLEILATRSKFYSDKHATYITDCLLRTLASYIKRKAYVDTFHVAMKLLSNILVSFGKWSGHATLDTCVSVERLLLVVTQTLQNPPEADGGAVLLSSGSLLGSLVGGELPASLGRTVLPTVDASLQRLLGLLPDCLELSSETSDVALRVTLVVSDIFSSTLRMFSSKQFSDSEVEEIIKKFHSYVLRSSSIILAVPMKIDNAELFTSYTQMLTAMYDNSSDQLCHIRVTNVLASQSFLRYLFDVSYWASEINPFIAALSQHLLAYRFELRFNTKLSVKALWLIVAALCLTPTGDFLVERSSQRSVQLIEQLEASGRSGEFFQEVYTHHPALLAWVFCCVRAPGWLQMRVITTWLVSDDYNNGIILKLLTRFPVVGCFLTYITVTFFFQITTWLVSDDYNNGIILKLLTRFPVVGCFLTYITVTFFFQITTWLVSDDYNNGIILKLLTRFPVVGCFLTYITVTFFFQITTWLVSDDYNNGIILKLLTRFPVVGCFLTYITVTFFFQITTWLVSDDYNNGIILKLLTRFPVVGCFLLDIIVQSDNKTAERAMKIIQQCLVSSKVGEQVLVSLWNSLPTALSCFNSMSVPNAGILMSLACQGIPDVVNTSSFVQVAWNLTRVLPQYDSSIHFYGEGFRLSSLILNTAQKLQDKRVPCMYLGNACFLETIQRAVMSESSYLVPLALQLLASLLACQSALQVQCRTNVVLDGSYLLAILSSHSWSVVSVSQFVNAALSSEIDHPCAKIADCSEGSSLSPDFIKTLYFKLQGFCATSLPSARAVQWGCLGTVLEYASARDGALACSLATQPWHHKLVQFAVLSSPDAAPHALQFCLRWLRCYRQHVLPPGEALARCRRRRYSLAAGSSLLARTLAGVSGCIQGRGTDVPPDLPGLVQDLQEKVCTESRPNSTVSSRRHAERGKNCFVCNNTLLSRTNVMCMNKNKLNSSSHWFLTLKR